MSLLSFRALEKLVKDGVITNVKPEYINSASIDITLGPVLKVEAPLGLYDEGPRVVDLGMRQPLTMTDHTIDISKGYDLKPGEFVLASSVQEFYLPNTLSAEYKLKSSMARTGLNHLNAGWCDAGWNGSVLTLELVNTSRYHTIRLHPNDRIGQMVFFTHVPVPDAASYAKRGRYNGDKTVSGVKA